MVLKNKIFIADPEGFALIVYHERKFIRLNGSDFKYDEKFKIFNISGKSFYLPGGINAMELEPRGDYLFFGILASHNLSVFYNSFLTNNLKQKSKLYDLQSGIIFKTQPTALRLSVENNVFFVGQTDNSIGCWMRDSMPIYERMVSSQANIFIKIF